MTNEVLQALLWRARAALRVPGIPVFAGHGVADPSYRPPRLPYTSVVGPLSVEIEAEREPPRALFIWVRTPGYVAGAALAEAATVPAGGELRLRLDGDATATLTPDLGGLSGLAWTDARARETAARIQAALEAAAFEVDGAPVVDPERQGELRNATVRWDRPNRRLVLSSGRRGVVPGFDFDSIPESAAEILPVPAPGADLGPALGFGEDAITAPGGVVRHRRPNPSAVAVDLRFDLWAASQQELAGVVDAWTRITPTRGQLLINPALLAADADDGDTTLRLQSVGEAKTRWTLVQLEPDGGFADRLSGQAPELVGAAVVEAGALRFTGSSSASVVAFESPPIPHAWHPEHPGATGYAASFGLNVDAGGTTGDAFRVFAVETDGGEALRVDAEFVTDVEVRLTVTAEQLGGAPFGQTVASVATTSLEQGVEVHAVVDATLGATALFVAGVPVGTTTGQAPGTPDASRDMRLVLGPAVPTPLGFRLTHFQLHGMPLGPVDPRLRRTLATGSAWAAGDPVVLVRTENGFSGTGEPFAAGVLSVAGNELALDRPLDRAWTRGETLVFKRSVFFKQRQLRRRDDLMNQLYRLTAEYRVSTFLDERFPAVSAPLVETTEVELRDLVRVMAETEDPVDPAYPARPARATPGVRTELTQFRGDVAVADETDS